ncbi:DUF485 domain-containing protein [Streptomyces alfalfae]|uniref:DUF485 domain-containing protein n=1 Tax=Streptomyces alfalfae TaxID=1642299 RepID=A0A1P8TN09_9ACTN|nr:MULTISPECIES: DUF485 domain-containing protein [Streptomyces]AYA19415.1 DUF485 domain-containing protein [Streptomyces fradiae]APY88998.1 hypothetical protein A7J05_27810 [Streptomyces alfalfae]KUL60055.1 hypothetical protein ADL30_08950 [Streptomyces sp. NRRL S-1521]QQC88599.1 DUF485 domain-containing protein [Streptomyces alfalfae]QUI31059.1 DUF485 domain-containing protein [Streptomyces alfalfae]
MATDAPPPSKGGAGNDPAPHAPSTEEFVQVQESAEFGELRRSHRSFAFPLTIAFIAWYLVYVLLSNYAGDFMGTKLFGNINVALVLGLGQFLTTFLIAWFYSRHAAAKLDPKAEAIKSRMENRMETRTEGDA